MRIDLSLLIYLQKMNSMFIHNEAHTWEALQRFEKEHTCFRVRSHANCMHLERRTAS